MWWPSCSATWHSTREPALEGPTCAMDSALHDLLRHLCCCARAAAAGISDSDRRFIQLPACSSWFLSTGCRVHRMMHESNLGWSFHVVHHSSMDYNYTVALRQGFGESLVSAAAAPRVFDSKVECFVCNSVPVLLSAVYESHDDVCFAICPPPHCARFVRSAPCSFRGWPTCPWHWSAHPTFTRCTVVLTLSTRCASVCLQLLC